MDTARTRRTARVAWLMVGVSLGLCADAAAQTVTVTFRNGENGYTGTKAANISTLSAGSWNGYNGTTFTDGADWCVGICRRRATTSRRWCVSSS